MSSEQSITCARRIFDITEHLFRAVGMSIGRRLISAVTAMMVIRQICGLRGRLLALEARFLAGTLPVRKPVVEGAIRASAGHVRGGMAGGEAVGLPRGYAWLCALVPSDAAAYAEHIRGVLAEPQMVALLAACPQAVRVLRPLCWMVGIRRAEYAPRVGAVAGDVSVPVRKGSAVPTPAAVVVEDGLRRSFPIGMEWLGFIPG